MLCSPADIEKKRQEALQKLAKKGSSPIKLASSSNGTSPAPQLQSGSSGSSPSFSFKKQFAFQGRINKKPYEKPAASVGQQNQNGNFYGNTVTTKMCLISSERFNAETSSYCQPVIEVFKTIPSKIYDPQSRTWNFHIKDYDLLLQKLAQLKSHNITVEKLPQFVISCLRTSISSCDIDITKLDPDLGQTLLPFQLEGLRFGVQRNGRCLIADDMGLGKTFQALAIMNYYHSDWPLLIATTASMKNVWEQTIFKYMKTVSILTVQYLTSSRDYIGDSRVLIVSHDLMSRCCDKLLERGFGCVIIDESHNLKNYKAKMTQAALSLAKRAKRVVLLSGTPALSRPSELYTQLSLIDSKFFGGFIEYAKRYCDMQKTHFGLDSSGKSNLQELEIVLNRKFMIRRRKEDVLGALPNKKQEIIKLDINLAGLDDQTRKLINTLAQQYTDVKKSVDKHAILLTFFSESAKIKIPSVCSFIYQTLESKKKFLVFGHHLVMLNAIEDVVKKTGTNYIRIDGSTTADQRKYFVDKFQTDEECRCAILSIMAANSGLTLTAAELVLFAELHWNPSILAQAEARAHRIGQEKSVLIQYLLASGTADDQIWPLLQEKQNILSEMGLCKTSFCNVDVKHQVKPKEQQLTIKEAFKSVPSEEDDALNDGFDDILCNVEF